MLYNHIQAKKVYHCQELNRQIKEKSKGCLIFDSIGEYKVFLELSNYKDKLILEIHKNIQYSPVHYWALDFKIIFKKREYLESICNRFSVVPYNNFIFIEYKGILDKNFIRKLDTPIGDLIKSTIFVSKELSGFSFYDRNEDKVIAYPLYSFDLFCSFWRESLK